MNIPPPHGRADNFMSIDRVSWFITARPDSVYAPRTSSSSHFLTKIDAWKFGQALASRLSVCSLKEGIMWNTARETSVQPRRNQAKNPCPSVARINWFCSPFYTKTASEMSASHRGIAAMLNSTSMFNIILLGNYIYIFFVSCHYMLLTCQKISSIINLNSR